MTAAGVLLLQSCLLSPKSGPTGPQTVASVSVAPEAKGAIQVGATETMFLSVEDAGGTQVQNHDPASWSSSDASVATVDTAGIVTGRSPGTATIEATVDGVSGTTSVEVVAQTGGAAVATVRIQPDNHLSFIVGMQQQFTATVLDSAGNVLSGKPVTWTADPNGSFTVSSTGLVTMVHAGGGTLTATVDGVSARTTVAIIGTPITANIDPDTATLAPGQGVELYMAVADSNDSGFSVPPTDASWSSDDASVATVDNRGQVTAVAEGVAHISGTYRNVTGTAEITVKDSVASVTVSPDSVDLQAGDSTQLTAVAKDTAGIVLIGHSTSWVTSDETIATVDSTGLVHAVGPGTATVAATVDGESGTAEVVVTSALPSHVVSVLANDYFTRKRMADGSVQTFDSVLIAGDHEATGDKDLQGFAIFPLDSLVTATSVEHAQLSVHFLPTDFEGNPFSLGTLYVELADDSASLNEGSLTGTAIQVASGPTDVTVDVAPLVRAALAANKSVAVLRFRFQQLGNNNNATDYALFYVDPMEVTRSP